MVSKPTKSDISLFIKLGNKETIYIVTYVDDIIITVESEIEISKVI